MSTKFKVGETLVCGRHYHRTDGVSEINPGDRVKVMQEFTFTHEGREIQDLTVQKGREAPVSVLVRDGDFRREDAP